MFKKQSVFLTSMFAFCLMMSLHAYQDEALLKEAVKTAVAGKAQEVPAIDGLLDDSCWRKASFSSDFFDFKSETAAKHKTEFAFCFDADNLYLAVRCKSGKEYTPKASEKLWDGDLLELFLDPGASGYDYFHIAVNPNGTTFKERGYGRSDSLWAPQIRAAGHVEKGEWTLEMALPLAEFQFREAIGSTWLINIARRDHENNGNYYTWAPVFGDLHQVSFFQPLKGLDIDISKFLWKAIIKGDSIISEKQPSVELELKNSSAKRQTIQLTMQTRKIGSSYPVTNSLGTFTVEANSSINIVSSTLFKKEPGHFFISLEGRDTLNRLHFRSRNYEFERTSDPLRISCSQKVYFKNETTCKAETRIFTFHKEDAILHFSLHPLNGIEKSINKDMKVDSEGKASVNFDISELQAGDYEISANLDASPVVKTQFTILERIIENPTISINSKQTLLVDGKPFFPRGLFMPGVWFGKTSECPTDETDWEDIKSKGFNFIKHSPFWMKTFMSSPPDGSRISPDERKNTWLLLDRIHKTGLKVAMTVNQFCYMFAEPDYEGLRNFVSEFRGHPAILCWYIADEPDLGNISPENLEKAYRIIKELDPARPVCILSMGAFLPYRNAADIFIADKYPIYDSASRPGTAVYSLSRAGVRSLKPGQTFWMTPQFFCNYPAESWKRCPTVNEAILMSFQAVCGGAKGFLYFAYAKTDRRSPKGIPTPYPLEKKRLSWELWEGSRRMNEMLIAAEPFILDGKPDQKIIIDKTGDNSKFVQTCILRLEGKILIVLCNSTATASNIQVKGLSEWKNVVCMDEEREENLELKDGFVPINMKPSSTKLLFCR